jgi:hypothetical protein
MYASSSDSHKKSNCVSKFYTYFELAKFLESMPHKNAREKRKLKKTLKKLQQITPLWKRFTEEKLEKLHSDSLVI